MIHIYRASKPDDEMHRKDDLNSHELIYSCNDYNFFRAQIPRELLGGEYQITPSPLSTVKICSKDIFLPCHECLSSLVELNLRPSESMPHPVLSQLENTFPE